MERVAPLCPPSSFHPPRWISCCCGSCDPGLFYLQRFCTTWSEPEPGGKWVQEQMVRTRSLQPQTDHNVFQMNQTSSLCIYSFILSIQLLSVAGVSDCPWMHRVCFPRRLPDPVPADRFRGRNPDFLPGDRSGSVHEGRQHQRVEHRSAVQRWVRFTRTLADLLLNVFKLVHLSWTSGWLMRRTVWFSSSDPNAAFTCWWRAALCFWVSPEPVQNWICWQETILQNICGCVLLLTRVLILYYNKLYYNPTVIILFIIILS